MTVEFKIPRIRYTFKGDWTSGYDYIKDNVVHYNGKTYVCLTTHTSSALIETDIASDIWVLMFDGVVWKQNWNINTYYVLGDIVKHNGYVYQCILPHTSASTTALGLEAAGVSPTAGAAWEVLFKADSFRGNWVPSTEYKLGDVVKYGGINYRCISSHISVESAASGLEADILHWESAIESIEYKGTWATATRYKKYDIVKYGGSLWISSAGHTSTTFEADSDNWSIYADGNQFETLQWASNTLYQRGDVVVYGGYTYRALSNNTGHTPSSSPSYWSIVTENYEFKQDWSNLTSYKVGDVVRLHGYLYAAIADSTNQEPPNLTYWQVIAQGSKWMGPWVSGTAYKLGDVVGYGPSTFECILAHSALTGNRPDTDIGGGTSGTYWKLYVQGTTTNVMVSPGDMIYQNSGAKTRLPVGSDGNVLRVTGTSPAWAEFTKVNAVYYVAPNGTDTTTSGRTLDKPFATVRYACDHITGPATVYVKSGIYSEMLPITVPAFVSLVGDELRTTVIQPASGYTTADMFKVSNGTAIRNMTLQGLSGTLGPANGYGTKRPTAGAYISLNPSSPIVSKSPYIQNVTTFGTGCTGLKVDGSAHASGFKSVVANDFTQVIDNGIGIWVTNDGRAELVSVFTYYAHIGYLTENGGRVRATDGNNSYGDFGTVSEGTSSSETPITGAVNNGGSHASIGFVFTDGNQILGLEYDNAGINYNSSTTYSFTGTGAGAAVSSANTRNGAVYEVRITDPGNTGSFGGGGYLNVINNAQAGSSSGTIYLAASDSNLASNYLGMRVVIISGKGAGQYGYISAYNASTKLATILKESDGTAGWDAMQSVNPVVDLDTTSQYSIEPRVTFSTPPSGITAQARVVVASGRLAKFRIFNPGSGYVTAPTITITDPQGAGVTYEVRTGNGVLANPTFSNRGTAYLTATATVTSGTGYADSYQYGAYLYVSGLSSLPGPGANVNFPSSSTNYRLVAVDNISGTGPYSARLQLYPSIELGLAPSAGSGVVIRVQYSQARLTGHDFLEVGTGKFATTNYPNIDPTTVLPQHQAVENGGGRVFYTATDQDGNYRVGGLFKVEQASGTATLNASFFSLNGLTQLTLGGIVLGGTSATITEISTDATMPLNSDGVIVTQRAIKSYIASRIGGGGANLNVNAITAGQISIANTNQITNTMGNAINFKSKVNFTGGVDGSMLSSAVFIASGSR